MSATDSSVTMTAPNVIGSVGATPQRNDCMSRTAANAAACTSVMLSSRAIGSIGSTVAIDCRIAAATVSDGPDARTTHEGENQVCTSFRNPGVVCAAGI